MSVVGNGTNGCSTTKTIAVTVNKCTGVTESLMAENVKIYPNPVEGQLQVDNAEKVRVTIFDLRGVVLLNAELEPGQHQLDVQRLSAGLYTMRTVSDSGTNTVRLYKTAN